MENAIFFSCANSRFARTNIKSLKRTINPNNIYTKVRACFIGNKIITIVINIFVNVNKVNNITSNIFNTINNICNFISNIKPQFFRPFFVTPARGSSWFRRSQFQDQLQPHASQTAKASQRGTSS